MADAGAILGVSGPVCERCGGTAYGSSHYHCGHCDSEAVTSMLGHYWRDEDGQWRFHCEERGGKVVRSETKELPAVSLERLSREQVYAEGIVSNHKSPLAYDDNAGDGDDD